MNQLETKFRFGSRLRGAPPRLATPRVVSSAQTEPSVSSAMGGRPDTSWLRVLSYTPAEGVSVKETESFRGEAPTLVTTPPPYARDSPVAFLGNDHTDVADLLKCGQTPTPK